MDVVGEDLRRALILNHSPLISLSLSPFELLQPLVL
uniref:Uncharacterized protein n=1 Tax=Nelumbo nucifera TaxID=4432 RepID=A0A822YJZ4_NELNU|nr:TPA_asm: hypothetical protein HUJ06_010703 [Nelumbo nucifera]